MAKIIDDFGYIIKIPDEELKAINLVDNGINPYKNMKPKSLQYKVRSEYKRRLIINIMGLIVKSSKNKRRLIKKMKIKTGKTKQPVLKQIRRKLHKMSMKYLDNLYKSLHQHGETKKKKTHKHSKTIKLRK
jgi:hypothetical protein|tara:strand:- start:874 stop:1266 length:393 start_codon:yes stop_codon:yes gene_type:complete